MLKKSSIFSQTSKRSFTDHVVIHSTALPPVVRQTFDSPPSSASERVTRSTKYSGSETADGFPFLFNNAVKMSGELLASPF